MKLYLAICEKENPYTQGKQTHFEKDVPWPCTPQVDATIFVGMEEDGRQSSISARVSSVNFYSSGDVVVEARIKNALEEYNDLCATMLRDGFTKKFER